jgi:hypothetical protein
MAAVFGCHAMEPSTFPTVASYGKSSTLHAISRAENAQTLSTITAVIETKGAGTPNCLPQSGRSLSMIISYDWPRRLAFI